MYALPNDCLAVLLIFALDLLISEGKATLYDFWLLDWTLALQTVDPAWLLDSMRTDDLSLEVPVF